MENYMLDMPVDRKAERAADERQCAEEHLAIDLNAAIANTTDGHKHLSLEPFECPVDDDGLCEFGLRVSGVELDRVKIAALVMEWAKHLATGG